MDSNKTTNRKGLYSQFLKIYAVFVVVTLLISGCFTYFSLRDFYQQEIEKNIKDSASYLKESIQADGTDFIFFQSYFMEHYEELEVRADFQGYQTEQEYFERLFTQTYPGKVLSVDVKLEDTTPEVQKAFVTEQLELWYTVFENAKKNFNLAYVYYFVPDEETKNSTYIIDGVRMIRNDGSNNLLLGDVVYKDPARFALEWMTWYSGEPQPGYQVWDNEYGNTYGYYVPLWIDGQKMGLICAEVEVRDVERVVFSQTMKQVVTTGIVLIIMVMVILYVIDKKFISKLTRLQDHVETYTRKKNVKIADEIRKEIKGEDEVDVLSLEISTLISDLEEYFQKLVQMTQDVATIRRQNDEITELIHSDNLTGLRNRISFENEFKKTWNQNIPNSIPFGLIVLDITNLSTLNKVHGREEGDVLIKKLGKHICQIFAHSPVFRTDGDEFTVIMEGKDLENSTDLMRDLVRELNQPVNEFFDHIPTDIGWAYYDAEQDKTPTDLLNRAKNEMNK